MPMRLTFVRTVDPFWVSKVLRIIFIVVLVRIKGISSEFEFLLFWGTWRTSWLLWTSKWLWIEIIILIIIFRWFLSWIRRFVFGWSGRLGWKGLLRWRNWCFFLRLFSCLGGRFRLGWICKGFSFGLRRWIDLAGSCLLGSSVCFIGCPLFLGFRFGVIFLLILYGFRLIEFLWFLKDLLEFSLIDQILLIFHYLLTKEHFYVLWRIWRDFH